MLFIFSECLPPILNKLNNLKNKKMERHLHEPLTLPKHPKLLEEINQTIIDIKIQDEDMPLTDDTKALADLRSKHKKHSWQDVVELLRRAYNAINEQRENP